MLAADVRRLSWPKDGFGTFASTVLARVASELAGVVERVSRLLCGLGGHVMVRHYERDRILLECMHCGERTPGWTIPARRSAATTRPA